MAHSKAHSMAGKYCLITGANSGIGKETALGLAQAGAHVVIAARDRQRGEAARAEIAQASGNKQVALLVADLSVSSGVHALAQQYRQQYGKLHVLINNAGGTFSKYERNADGMEMTFALNYLSPFLLVHLLLDLLQASSPARIINVASRMQSSELQLDKLLDPGAAGYRSLAVYSHVKLANIMFTYAMARRLEGTGVTVNAVHPGIIFTPQSSRGVPAFMHPLLRLFMASPAAGAAPSVKLAVDPQLAGETGRYYDRLQPKSSRPCSYDVELQERLYAQSLEWAGLAPDGR